MTHHRTKTPVEEEFSVNQVLFAKHLDKWYPAVVIDAEDKDTWKVDLSPKASGHLHVLWLGSGKVSLAPLSILRDFCKEFTKCMSNHVNTDPKYVLAISLAVKLAAVRSGSSNPENAWLSWGQKHLSKCQPLLVTQAFYRAVVPSGITVDNSSPSAPTGQGGSKKSLDLKTGQFVWVKAGLSDDYWPSLVMDVSYWPPRKVGVVVLTKEARKYTSSISDIHDYCSEYSSLLNQNKLNDDREFKRAVKLAIKNIRQTLTGEEINDKEYDYFSWGKKNLPAHKGIVASMEVQDYCFEKYPPGEGTYHPDEDCDIKTRGNTPPDPKPSQHPHHRPMKAFKTIKKRSGGSLPTKESGASESKKMKEEEGESAAALMDSGVGQMEPELTKKKEKKERLKAEKKTSTPKSASSEASSEDSPKKKRQSFGKKGPLTDEELELLKIPLDRGWERILVYRKEKEGTPAGPGKKGDIYYKPPDGSKRLRSNPEVLKYFEKLGDESDLAPGTHFSFREVALDHPLQTVQQS